jgi:cyclophilin family peptidyl-prolyl cis-trans isomerase
MFEDECAVAGGRKINQKGLLCMANAGLPNTNTSQVGGHKRKGNIAEPCCPSNHSLFLSICCCFMEAHYAFATYA